MSSNYELVPPESAPDTRPGDPSHAKSPSYPQRVHLDERSSLEATLASWDSRIAGARKKLDVVRSPADRPRFERLYAQMLGSRDQIAEAVRRLPMEVGGLYKEDKHRLDEAVAALERIFKRWG